MLPNFRKADQDQGKSQPTFSPVSMDAAAPTSKAAFTVRPGAEPRTMSVVGADLTINGNLVSKGQVQVDGIVDGDIHGANVIIGQTATVTGEVVADEVIIRGHVVGAIRSKRVMLQATSEVEGDIYHQSLSIEQGAMFEGKSRRTSEDPRTLVINASAPKSKTEDVVTLPTPPRLPELPN